MPTIKQNTYPEFGNVAHAKKGDKVTWTNWRGCFDLVRQSDNAIVFSTAAIDDDSMLRSNGKQPKLFGIIAQVKSKGWILELEAEVLQPVCNHPKSQEPKVCEICNGMGGVEVHECPIGMYMRKSYKNGDVWRSRGTNEAITVICCSCCGKKLDKIPCPGCGKVRSE